MLDSVLPEEVWKEAQPVLSIQGEVDWEPHIHDVFIRALHTVSLDHGSSGSISGPLGSALTSGGLGSMAATISTQIGTPGLNGIVNVPFRFLSLAKTVVFPPKKPTHPLKAADGRPLEGYTVRGLVKQNWIKKHVSQLPSAAILLAPFDNSWSAAEWGQREQVLWQDMERLRQQVGPRDVRIFVVLIRRAGSPSEISVGGTAEGARESEERLVAFRRRTPPVFEAGKMVYVLQDTQDLQPSAPALRKLYKHVRDLSSGYYFLHGKRVKRWESALNRHAQLPLIVRYRFKQAFWYEFMGHAEKALKHFKKTFDALIELQAGWSNSNSSIFPEGPTVRGGAPALGSSSSMTPSPAASQATALQSSNVHMLGGWVSQIKAVAEVVAFKICYYSMREARHGEALNQFRLLVSTWGWKKQQRVGRAIGGGAGVGRSFMNMMPSPSFSSSSSSSSTSTSSSLDGSHCGGLDTTPRGAAGTTVAAARTEYNRLDFLFYEWTARQYQIFGDLLQLIPCPPSPYSSSSNGSSNSSSSAAAASAVIETYMDPDHYFFNAALAVAKQREVGVFLHAFPGTESKFLVRLGSHFGLGGGPLLGLPLYMGGRPRLVDSSIENGMGEGDITEVVQLILERKEATGGEVRREEVLRLLMAAVSVHNPSKPRRPRFKGMQHLRLADELMEAGREGEAWRHYCAALWRYGRDEKGGLEGGGCGGNPGWSLPTVVTLQRMRVCALRLGGVEEKVGQYLDLTLKLLSQDLRGVVGEEKRIVFWEEVLFLLFGVQREEGGQQQQVASSSLSSIFTFQQQQQRQTSTTVTASVSKLGPVTYDDCAEASSSVSTSLGPMLTLLPDTVQIDLNCGWRQLVSFSVCFPEATAAMGGSCQVLLRVVSHLPLPLRASEMLLRFNKPYIGALRIVEASSLPASTASALDRVKQSFTAAPAAVSPPLQSAVKVDDQKTAHVALPLLLQPDTPFDILLTLDLPTDEAVEIGDMLHAVQLQLLINAPTSTSISLLSSLPSSPFPPLRRSLYLNIPSGVAYVDGFGVTRANVFKGLATATATTATGASPSSSLVTQPSSLPVPLQASLRGFPALEVIRPVAHASLALRTQKEAEEGLVTSLVGHLHCLWLKVESNEDTLTNPMLYVRSDPPTRSSRVEDAFFFGNSSNSSISRGGPVPLKLGKDMQPEAALPVLPPSLPLSSSPTTTAAVLSPQSSVLVPVWVRPLQEGRVKINMALVYHAAAPAAVGGTGRGQDVYSNLLVSFEYVFDLESYIPFLTAFDVASPCPALPPAPNNKIPRALQGDTDNDSSVATAAAYTFYTGEQVLMRLSIKALQPSSWGESQGGGRPRIEQVVWHPVERGNWASRKIAAISDKEKERRNENGAGRVLYSFARDGNGGRGGGGHYERGMRPQDVLTLTFPFLCPETESSQALPLGQMRLYWRVVSISPSSSSSSSSSSPSSPSSSLGTPTAAPTSSSSSSSWLACTEAECPSVGVVAPDITVHLHAPIEAVLGQAFKLRWTLRNLTEKVLTVRVVLQEGGGGNSGPSTEEALVWSGARESVVQVLPHASLHLRYHVVAVLTGPIALPRLVLTRMPDAAAVSSNKKEEGGTSLPLRVAYRYVDNVLSNSTLFLSTPRSAETRGSVAGGQPSDTRHLFVFPEAANNQ